MKRNIAGHRIQAARALHKPKLTQDDLIAMLHTKQNIVMSKNTLSRIEIDERYVTDLELVAFAKVLKVSTAWLLGETNDPTVKSPDRSISEK